MTHTTLSTQARRITGGLVATLIAGSSALAQSTFSHDTGSCTGNMPMTTFAAWSDLRTENAPFAPVIGISHVDLGLDPDDDIDAVSFGDDRAIGRGHVIVFSVDAASVGAAGTDVRFEATVGSSGMAPEAAGDLFVQRRNMPGNVLAPAGTGYDAGTTDGDQSNATWQVPAAAGFADDLDAFDYGDPATATGVYFSLACGSPSLAALGMSPGDILFSDLSGAAPVLAILAGAGPATAANLGIPGQDLDALNLLQVPGAPGVIRPGNVGPTPGGTGVASTHFIEFSIAPGGAFSPAAVLVRVGAGAAAVSTPPAALGLIAGMDDLNALEAVRKIPEQPNPNGFGPAGNPD